ncbi:MFS transporter [Clostridium cellulovorans]|uniref:Major facilitator superfamily permease n=1 Tax=Clostridium cellulovorans (strain ATCC 35296 / DSM 3052 / OCM 3 / 743B) TaxID=573061 RepID=D9SVK4_CLOC7|nr:MFS transporter [Clostridium cellulovorans]ADL51128.1 major facilitator superfamily permease [Clostridium cellulovorans 743B]
MTKLNREEKSWALYDWANSAYSITVTSTVLPLYFKGIANNSGVAATTSTAYWGYGISIATLIVAILAPVLGTIADYRGYKKKFFKLFLSLGLIFTALLAVVPENQWIVLLVINCFTIVGFSGAEVFYDAFLVDVTDDDKMDKVSATGFALGYIGSTIPFIICIGLIVAAQTGAVPFGVSAASRIAFVITAIWWGIFSIPMLKNVEQKYSIEPEEKPIRKSFVRLLETFKNIKEHKIVFMFLLAYFFYIDGVHTIIGMSTSYGSDLGIKSTTLLVILLVGQFVAFPCALIFGRLSSRFSGKKVILCSIAIYTGICIYAYFLKTELDFWILALLVCSCQGGIQAISRSYLGRLVPKENSSKFFGFYNIFGKFASVMGPALIGVVSQATGKTNNGVFSLIVLFIIGGLFLMRVPDTEKESKVLGVKAGI